MKSFLGALMAVALLAGTAFALPPNIAQTGDGLYHNTITGEITDVNGNALQTESYPDQDLVLLQPSILSSLFYHRVLSATQPAGTVLVDSMQSGVSTQGFSKIGLWLYPTDSLSGGTSLVGAWTIALRIRWSENGGSDTLSTFTQSRLIKGTGTTYMGTYAAGAVDSINGFNAAVTEAAANDSLAYPDEKVVVIPHTVRSRGFVVWLSGYEGLPIAAPYIQVCWRHLNTYDPNLAALGEAAAQSSNSEPWLRLRADLVGAR